MLRYKVLPVYDDQSIDVVADECQINQDGSLVFLSNVGTFEKRYSIVHAFAKGYWTEVLMLAEKD